MNHTNGNAESDGWFLSGAGSFLYANDITFVAASTMVTVVARGDYVSGAWPLMSVSAEGQTNIIGTASVTSTTMTPYSFTFVAKAMNSGFGVNVTSGSGLHVQSIAISCPTGTTTTVATSTGTATATSTGTGTATGTSTATATGAMERVGQ
jgi:hypothetical protein